MENVEIWKNIPGYEGIYQCSNLGRIKSLGNDRSRKEKILKQFINENGYYNLILWKNGKTKTYKVHQLVCIVFLSHDKNSNLVVDHKDGDTKNKNYNEFNSSN